MNQSLSELPRALLGKLLYWLVPIGVSLPWWGVEKDPNSGLSQIPKGYLIMDGTTYRVADYPRLAKALGSTYGGDGVSTFAVPDLRGRSPVGKDDMGGTAANRITSGGSGIPGTTLGAVGGAETVALVAANHAPHHHQMLGAGSASGTTGSVFIGAAYDQATGHTPTSGVYRDTDSSGNTLSQNQGSGTAHQNVQPTIICNWIIRAG